MAHRGGRLPHVFRLMLVHDRPNLDGGFRVLTADGTMKVCLGMKRPRTTTSSVTGAGLEVAESTCVLSVRTLSGGLLGLLSIANNSHPLHVRTAVRELLSEMNVQLWNGLWTTLLVRCSRLYDTPSPARHRVGYVSFGHERRVYVKSSVTGIHDAAVTLEIHCPLRGMGRDHSEPFIRLQSALQVQCPCVQRQGGVVDSVEVRCSGVGGGPGGAHSTATGRIEGKRRVVVEELIAYSARKQFEQEVAALSKLQSAHQRQHKAAVDACVLLAETGDKVKEQKLREQASVKAALETSREAGTHHAGCGGEAPQSCHFWLQPSARGSSNATCRPASGTRTRTWNPSWSCSGSSASLP